MPRRKSKPRLTSSSSSSSKVSIPNPRIFDAVADDVLRQILLRLPRDSLLSSRLVSTRWLEVTTDPSFVRSYRSLRPPMLGFFYHHHRASEDPPVFVPTARSPDLKSAVGRVGPALHFLPHRGNFRLMDCCEGLLLLAEVTTETNTFVCNPLTKELVEAPHPPLESSCLTGLTCYPSGFHVVLLLPLEQRSCCMEDGMRFYKVEVRMFSSDDPTWRVCSPMYPSSWGFGDSVRVRHIYMHTPPVFLRGVLYWLNGKQRLLVYDEKRANGNLVEVKLPEGFVTEPHITACLGKAEGNLCYAKVNKTHLKVWLVRGDYPNFEWTLKHQIEWSPRLRSKIQHYESNPPLSFVVVEGLEFPLARANMKFFISEIVRPIGFHCTDSNTVYLAMGKKAFSYHLQTRELKDLSCARSDFTRIYPYEMPESPIPLLGTTAGMCSSGHKV